MKIKDIVNRDIVNLTNCEHEPIHIPGSIQPHGFLIAIKKKDYTIDFCSANSLTYINLRPEQLLSKSTETVLGHSQHQKMLHYIASQSASFSSPLEMELNGSSYNVSIHASGDRYILEFEPGVSSSSDLSAFYNQTRQFVTYMERSTSLQKLCQTVADETRSITGYDRVMIYRFDKDYNGEVFAESKRDDIESFLGVHYPHTDIPAQARALYKQNLLRLIVDVNYQPVPIFTIDDEPSKNLDLGNALLRSVSPIHVQYLHNIGVGATLTISLMHQDELWGLIACHHYSVKYINSFTRISAQLQGHFLTSQINVRQVEEQHTLAKQVNSALEKMLAQTNSLDRQSFKMIAVQKELLALCNANGVAIFIDNDIYSGGNVPSQETIRSIITALKLHSDKDVIFSSKLVDIYPEAASISDTSAGILLHLLDDVLNMGVIWFRHETLEEVKWAGDPSKAIIKDEKGLSPRKSFELWKEVKKFQSSEWREAELYAAATFAQSLEKQMHLLFLSEEEQKYRVLSEKLKETNAELENVNWISTHDLKEPLRKIQVFASRILDRNSDELSSAVIDSIQRMNNSASRMQTLISDILTYSKMQRFNETLTEVNLTLVVNEVVNELNEDIVERHATITGGKLPAVDGVSFMLHQLFINLIRNSLKFARPDIAPVIDISFKETVVNPERLVPGSYYAIVVKDNGIGFSDQHKDAIFNVFTRLHAKADFTGSGIGLALCKKIMQNHKGLITAHGKINEGAEFTLYFPAKV
jgi:chemotaxis family two-component system sensor kinase Cph1